MIGARDLTASERGIWCVAVLLLATVLAVVGKLLPEWVQLVTSITAYLLAAKTATGYIESRSPKP